MRCRFAVAAATTDDGCDGEVSGFNSPDGGSWRSGRNVLVKADAASLVLHDSGGQHLSHFKNGFGNVRNSAKEFTLSFGRHCCL